MDQRHFNRMSVSIFFEMCKIFDCVFLKITQKLLKKREKMVIWQKKSHFFSEKMVCLT